MAHEHHDGDQHSLDGRDHSGKLVTFDQFDTTTYVHTDIAADRSFTARFILQVDGFELNGSPVHVPGIGSHTGMYFLIDATGIAPAVGADTFSSMNVALMVDPNNNDGRLSASLDGVGFANGTADDITLATGTLKQAGITFDGNIGHPSFFETISLTTAGQKVFGDQVDVGAVLHELLTTPGGPKDIPVPGGGITQVVNGTGAAGLPATAFVTLDPKTPLSIRPALLDHAAYGDSGSFCCASN